MIIVFFDCSTNCKNWESKNIHAVKRREHAGLVKSVAQHSTIAYNRGPKTFSAALCILSMTIDYCQALHVDTATAFALKLH